MSSQKMHADEVETDAALVSRLVASQFPRWADLTVERVDSAGTDNALYRLGADLVVRLPRIHWAVDSVEDEYAWVPRLAPRLPVAVPVPLAKGTPALGYPWPWTICRWLDGDNPGLDDASGSATLAAELAAFVRALHRVELRGGPRSNRGLPLASRDTATREAIAELGEQIDGEAVTAAWNAASNVPPWEGPPVWVHGDLSALNLLCRRGRLRAVLDFGSVGVGDPACDVIPAWCLFSAGARARYRAALRVDDATWERGRGWALTVAVVQLPYYQHTNPVLAGLARRSLREVLADPVRAHRR